MLLLLSAGFFQNLTFSKILSGTLSVSIGLDSDHDQHSVGPNLVPNYLKMLSAGDISRVLIKTNRN